MSYASRVNAGAEFLDTLEPGWYDRVDLRTLDIRNTYNCILGQLFKHFAEGEKYLLDAGAPQHDEYGGCVERKWLDDHGFDLTFPEYMNGPHGHALWLEKRWTQAINKRIAVQA